MLAPMSRDPNLVKRNAFVIPGAILAFVCLVGIGYGMGLRDDPGYGCSYGGAGMLLWNQCYHVVTVFTPPLVLALFLILFGMLRYRGQPEELEDHLHPGTGQHVTLAVIVAAIVMPLLVWLGLRYQEGKTGSRYILDAVGTTYEMTFLLELAVIVGLLVLAVFLVAYLAEGRMRNNFLHAAQELTRDQVPEEEEFGAYDDEGAFAPLDDGGQDDGAWDETEEPWQDIPVEDAPAPEPEAAPEPWQEAAAAQPIPDVAEEGEPAAWSDEPEGEPNETPEQQLEEPTYRPVRARPEDTFADDPDAAPLADEWDEQ